MQNTKRVETGGQIIWHNTAVLPTVDPHFFEPDWHKSQGQLRGIAKGRGNAHFVHAGGYDLVLRPFRRGGLIGKINTDAFLRTGAARSRGYLEYTLLEWMHAQGFPVPVPVPVAARYVPRGLLYRADLVTQQIAGASPLADRLTQTALSYDVWSDIGRVVRQMHDLGVHHSDLNCRNILLDAQDKVCLIDFDKCWRRDQGSWQFANLARLRRSLDKERAKVPALYWAKGDWTAFTEGYEAKSV